MEVIQNAKKNTEYNFFLNNIMLEDNMYRRQTQIK
jgi:hypothetical protein